jgi:hypothetical protein
VLHAILYNLADGAEIADLTEFSTIKLSPRLSRPFSVTVTLPGEGVTTPGDPEILRGLWGDGDPVLRTGRRGIKVLRDGLVEDGILIGNTILWNIAPSGDENTTEIVLTGYDALALFAKRFARFGTDVTSNLYPNFVSPVTGAEILLAALSGSIETVGPLPIDIETGFYETTVDLTPQLMNWPMRISELASLLANTGVVDIVLDPVDDAPDALGVLSVVDRTGRDLSETETGPGVHFDYGTGDFSVSKVRRMEDLDELCNGLVYLLGPKLDASHWRGTIRGSESGLEDYLALEEASLDKYIWTHEDIRIFDDTEMESANRALFTELWKTEVVLRVEPRELLYLTPAAGEGCPFQPYDDYQVGDIVGCNIADIVGPEFAGGKQRIYGFDLEQDRNGPERVSELIVSPDGVE